MAATTLVAAQLWIGREVSRRPALVEAAAVPLPRQTDLGDVRRACQRGYLNLATVLARQIQDPAAREQALEIITFERAGAALAEQDIALSTRLAERLPFSLKRSLVLVAVAAENASAHDANAASRNLRRAIAEGGTLTPSQRERLLTMAAWVYGTFDQHAARSVLRSAVQAHKTASATNHGAKFRFGDVGVAGDGFYEVIRAGSGAAEVFPLRLPALPQARLDELVLAYFPG